MTASDPSLHPVHTLYSEHHGWLQGWLRRKLGCTFEAADLMHDTFVRVLDRSDRSDLNVIREPRAYLTTIAHGIMVNHVRRKDLERAYLQALAALPEAVAPSPEARAIALEALIDIDRLLDGLPPRVRRAFLLNQLEGLTHAEIAEQLAVSVSSIRQYLVRAMTHCLTGAAA
ncbi:sigma-70 family RNA polymerase sigma factor [Alcaligenaceae bacterium B3P038]|nr:sigma-70 family RNA polymerase sigma factor [Alcaligenaceae bacterium B3P038]